MPCREGPLAKSNDTPSHCKSNQVIRQPIGGVAKHWLLLLVVEVVVVVVVALNRTHHDVDVFVQVLARGRERLRGSEFKVPQFVFHSAVELLRVLFPLRMEFDANGSIL